MSRIKALLESKITWAFILIFIFYVSYVFSGRYARILEMRVYIQGLEEEVEILEEENQQLIERVDLLNTPSYIEKIAREELDLVKPNEILFKSTKNP